MSFFDEADVLLAAGLITQEEYLYNKSAAPRPRSPPVGLALSSQVPAPPRPQPISTSSSSSSSSTGSAWSSSSSASTSSSSVPQRQLIDLTEPEPQVKVEPHPEDPADQYRPPTPYDYPEEEFRGPSSPAYSPTSPSYQPLRFDDDDSDTDVGEDDASLLPLALQMPPQPQPQQQQQQQPITLHIASVQQLSITHPAPLPAPAPAPAPVPRPSVLMLPALDAERPRVQQQPRRQRPRQQQRARNRNHAALPYAAPATAEAKGVQSVLFAVGSAKWRKGVYKKGKAPVREDPTPFGIISGHVVSLPDERDQAMYELNLDIGRFTATMLDALLGYVLECPRKVYGPWRANYVRSNPTATPLDMIHAARASGMPLRPVRTTRKATAITAIGAEAIELLLTARDKEAELQQSSNAPVPMEQDPDDERLTCTICDEAFAAQHITSCAPGSNHLICKACLYNYVVKTRSAKCFVDLVPCYLGNTCSNFYSGDFVRSILPRLYLDKMEKLEVVQAINAVNAEAAESKSEDHAGFLICKCGETTLLSKEDVRQQSALTCTKCDRVYCTKCGRLAHPGQACNGASDGKNESEENIKWMEQHAKRCPRCNVWIEKNHGCNHMTCTHCSKEFCWTCRGNWPRCVCVINREQRAREVHMN